MAASLRRACRYPWPPGSHTPAGSLLCHISKSRACVHRFSTSTRPQYTAAETSTSNKNNNNQHVHDEHCGHAHHHHHHTAPHVSHNTPSIYSPSPSSTPLSHNSHSTSHPIPSPASSFPRPLPASSPSFSSSGPVCRSAQVVPEPESFYRRPLPDTLIAFSSPQGRKLFQEALQDKYMEGYFSLAEQFVSQSEPAFCGLATLAMSLNALYIDPNRLWKGPWRWFAEDMFDCCTPIESVKKRGVTFAEFNCLARCNGADVLAFRADESSLQHFRESIKQACSQESTICVASYSRAGLGQTGAGHYSPIGGYHQGLDLALVLDVARFKYAPHWVSVEVLWKAMLEADVDTARPRGFFMLRQNKDSRHNTFCRLASPSLWAKVADHFIRVIPNRLRDAEHRLKSVDQVVQEIVRNLPPEATQVLQAYPDDLQGRLHADHMDALNKFFDEIAQTKMYRLVQDVLARNKPSLVADKFLVMPFANQLYGAQVATILLLACPAQLYSTLPTALRDEMSVVRGLDALPPEVRGEVMQIREQMLQVQKSGCKCEGGPSQTCANNKG
eukprot:TRINITY_DN4796_c0_g1_i3.p1 TRINITY_DN4796_c0_g1~~TRINITY_DN4796_c0_g1_i3.p1  ORF type:complete len:565 (+),score=89.98 TRINITY_DN4796_c0_g1_i3:25-1695(+)